MELRFSKLYLAFITLCGCLALGSCSRQELAEDDAYGTQPWDDSPVIMLHIGTLNTGRQALSDVQEKIRSLRIIMIHEANGSKYIEANRLIDTHTADLNFSYIFQKRTIAGKKSFYLIANEESVQSVSLTGGNAFPEKMGAHPTLTQFLNYFDPNMPEEDGAAAANTYTTADFETMLSALYFEPETAYESAYVPEENQIFLPYSAYYYSGFDIKATDRYEVDFTDKPMYLVPAATKFSFKFINERTKSDVAIDYLAIESRNKTNYLMAKLADWEQTKAVSGGKSYYWIDWLKFVSDELESFGQSSDDNVDVNGMYGWISSYEVPFPNDDEEYAFVPDGPADDPAEPTRKSSSWILPAATDTDGKIVATTTEFGPFYLPEGHHLVTEDIEGPETSGTGGSAQANQAEKYILKLKMRDNELVEVGSQTQVKKAQTEISNLKYLFRNTRVLITITLREGGVNIFAKPVPWNKEVFFGYVEDEDMIK